MAELHCNVYYRHKDAEKHALLRQLVDGHALSREEKTAIAEQLNEDEGSMLYQQFADSLEKEYREDLYPESTVTLQGYWCSHLVLGGQGDYLTGRVVKFLNDLSDEIQALAWGCGDDDPWEFWFKYENGRVIRCDDEPYEDDDERIYNTIYRWWHEGLPDGIQEGFLNDEDDTSMEITWTDDRYDEWVAKLRQRSERADADDLAEQGVESPVSTEDVEELMEGIGQLFSMFKGAAKLSGNPQENAFDAEQITEDNLMEAYNDQKACEEAIDLEGVLKHVSKNLSGKVDTLDEEFAIAVPLTYGMYKLGLSMILKPDVRYQSSSEVESVELLDDQRARMTTNSITEFVDPETKKLTRVHSHDSNIWSIEDGKLLIVEIESKEIKKEQLE